MSAPKHRLDFSPRERPYEPAPFKVADVHAFKALSAGVADPAQQKRALDWLINHCCGTYDLSFRPGGHEGDRNSCVAEGKRFVGTQVVKLVNLAPDLLATMEREENDRAKSAVGTASSGPGSKHG